MLCRLDQRGVQHACRGALAAELSEYSHSPFYLPHVECTVPLSAIQASFAGVASHTVHHTRSIVLPA